MVAPSFTHLKVLHILNSSEGAQWLSGRVLDSRPKGRGFEPHRRHSVVSLSKNINPSLVLVQPRKTRPFITERLLMGRKESNQSIKINSSEAVAPASTHEKMLHILYSPEALLHPLLTSRCYTSLTLLKRLPHPLLTGRCYTSLTLLKWLRHLIILYSLEGITHPLLS